jgi:LCP family protein required for cell wall assembly
VARRRSWRHDLKRKAIHAAAGLALSRATVNVSVARHLHAAPSATDGALVVLIVGSDGRRALTGRVAVLADDVAGARADAIVLAVVVPAAHEVTVLSIPRDLIVDMPVIGPQKLGWALDYGGASLITQLASLLTGLHIHHYVEMDFQGFAGLIDAAGGIRVTLPTPAHDSRTGLALRAGHQRITGQSALALARSRHNDKRISGNVVRFPLSDQARMQRQQLVIAGLMARVRRGVRPSVARWLVSEAAQHVTIDDRLTAARLVRVASAIRAGAVHSASLPVRWQQASDTLRSPFPPHQASGSAYLELDEPAASTTLRNLRAKVDPESCGDLRVMAPTPTTYSSGSLDPNAT